MIYDKTTDFKGGNNSGCIRTELWRSYYSANTALTWFTDGKYPTNRHRRGSSVNGTFADGHIDFVNFFELIQPNRGYEHWDN